MAIAVYMPQLGESVVEGAVSRWLKHPGEHVDKLEPLLEISTDKIDTEVPAPASGALLKVVVEAGQIVTAGTVLGYIGDPGEATPGDETPSIDHGAGPARQAEAAGGEKPAGRAFISPVVARMAAEHQVDLDEVSGSGAKGRITKKDIQSYINTAPRTPPAPPSSRLAQAMSAPEDEELIPLTPIRRAIAEHMVRSLQTSAHVTSIFEVDMLAVLRHRERHREAFLAKGIRLTVTPYLVAAAVAGLKEVPELNSRYTDAGIQCSRRMHIGIATALEEGLIVPVVQDADEKNLQGLAREINQLVASARTGELRPDQIAGGTFTLTNHGVGGSIAGTPILNQPQAGILGVGAIVKRPVVRSDAKQLLPHADDAILIRPIALLSLTFDHRILDGAPADRFLRRVKTTLENWEENQDG